jgi:sterol desaturase/sphingolipid hydroxylase (fatty acid hydroxylase superfamily)
MLRTVIFLAALTALLGVAERANPDAWRRQPVDRRSLRTDLGWVGVYLVYVPALGAVVAGAAALAGRHSLVAPLVSDLPWAVRLAGAIVVADLAAYVLHRLQHTWAPLWRIHDVHHSTRDLRWWSAFRFHPVDTALVHGVPIVAAAALGAGPDVLVPYLASVTIVTVFAHADVFVPGSALSRVVVTPDFHRAHHEPGRSGRNFALVLPIWDVLFRTASFRAPEPGRATFGSISGIPAHGLRDQLAWGLWGAGPSRPTIRRGPSRPPAT